MLIGLKVDAILRREVQYFCSPSVFGGLLVRVSVGLRDDLYMHQQVSRQRERVIATFNA